MCMSLGRRGITDRDGATHAAMSIRRVEVSPAEPARRPAAPTGMTLGRLYRMQDDIVALATRVTELEQTVAGLAPLAGRVTELEQTAAGLAPLAERVDVAEWNIRLLENADPDSEDFYQREAREMRHSG